MECYLARLRYGSYYVNGSRIENIRFKKQHKVEVLYVYLWEAT